jgi:hypothetical protein
MGVYGDCCYSRCRRRYVQWLSLVLNGGYVNLLIYMRLEV